MAFIDITASVSFRSTDDFVLDGFVDRVLKVHWSMQSLPLSKLNLALATIIHLMIIFPVSIAAARVNGVNVNIDAQQTIVVDDSDRIRMIVSNATVEGIKVVRRDEPSGPIIDMNENIETQYEEIMASNDGVWRGVMYESQKGWFDKVMDFIGRLFSWA